MAILLVRHAQAVPEQVGVDDAVRWLTTEGRGQVREVAALLRARKLPLARFVTSPRVRAVQTAELLAHGLDFGGAVEALPSLSYTVPAERAVRELSALESALDAGSVLVAVGHMPTLAEITARLTGGKSDDGLGLSEARLVEGGKLVWSAAPRA